MSYKYKLYGAIFGDIAGQPFEYKPNTKQEFFQLYNPDAHITDDSIMTLAAADAILHNKSFEDAYKEWFNLYPDAKYGYGGNFEAWCQNHPDAHTNSYGNGAIMKIAPVIYANASIIDAVKCSHDHEDSYQAAFTLKSLYKYKGRISIGYIKYKEGFQINSVDTLDICLASLRFTESFKQLFSILIKIGGDVDTNCSIAGELLNNKLRCITERDAEYIESKLDERQLSILKEFNEKY